MRAPFAIIIATVVIISAGCMRAAKDILPWRWSFNGVYLRNEDAFVDTISHGESRDEAMERFFLDYKLVLRADNTFDLVLFKQYMHGKWLYEDKSKLLTLTSNATDEQLQMQVDSITPVLLALHVNQGSADKLLPLNTPNYGGMGFFKNHEPYIFILSADKEKYNSEDEDPYSQKFNAWRVKPTKPENAQQLNIRLQNHVMFIRRLMQDVVDGRKTYISLHSFHTPLIIASDDIRLQHYEATREDWDVNFYDSAQALQAYKILEKAVLYNGVKRGANSDRFVNNVKMLDEVLEHLKKL